MAKVKTGAAKPVHRAANRRGSPEAIEKRKAARIFNDVLGGRGLSSHKLDGRTEKRRQRLLRELENGTARGARELKPLDILQRVQELLELGEPLSSIRKVSKVRKLPALEETSSSKASSKNSPKSSMVDVVERLHKAYGFRAEAYRFVGIGEDVLRSAGVLSEDGARARRPKKRAP